jgi:hypothetical protein
VIYRSATVQLVEIKATNMTKIPDLTIYKKKKKKQTTKDKLAVCYCKVQVLCSRAKSMPTPLKVCNNMHQENEKAMDN